MMRETIPVPPARHRLHRSRHRRPRLPTLQPHPRRDRHRGGVGARHSTRRVYIVPAEGLRKVRRGQGTNRAWH